LVLEGSSVRSALEELLIQSLEYPHHRLSLLEESTISPQVIVERGYYTAKSKAELGRLGFSPSQRLAPALVIPMYAPTGELTTHQVRPDAPREIDGKAVKYETPAKSPLRLDVHPTIVHKNSSLFPATVRSMKSTVTSSARRV